jgi:Tfp pilus assembly protein PilN
MKNISMVFLAIFVIAIASYVILQLQMMILKKGIHDRQQILDSFDQIQVQYLAETKQKITDLTVFWEQMGRTKQAIEELDNINLELVKAIFANVPQGVLFKELDLSRTNLTIIGKADTRAAIAELEYHLRNSGLCTNLKMINIIFEDNKFNFNLQADLL